MYQNIWKVRIENILLKLMPTKSKKYIKCQSDN